MSPGSNTENYLAFARIGLRENPGKNLNQVTCPDRDSNPGHLVSRPDALTVYGTQKNHLPDLLVISVVPSAQKLGIRGNFIFMQDNDHKHMTHNTRLWILYSIPSYLQTPPQSPDIRPKTRHITSKESLKTAIIEEWNNIPASITSNLVNSIPRSVSWKAGGKKTLRRRRCRWEDNIKTDLREVEYDGRDSINLAQDRDRWRAYVRAAMNLRVLYEPFVSKKHKCHSNPGPRGGQDYGLNKEGSGTRLHIKKPSPGAQSKGARRVGSSGLGNEQAKVWGLPDQSSGPEMSASGVHAHCGENVFVVIVNEPHL
ncbi:hypothetical protein ANN_19706 [Periplaneta americana]|uniref:Uncharacterized protein n=1 Tax=Periplaneta americana TaxID=6978 RepID=A0ABQ8SAL9_PERAM|nr:hypothetical protein ANN_19706 [Periplaneta americana]